MLKSDNIFKDGMVLGVHPSVQPASTTRKATNFRVVTRDNTSFIMTNLRGNQLKSTLSPGFVPVAIADRNGVAYIISAQVSDGVPTGVGEIGCFPSPNYTDGNLTFDYRPLMNYGGDDNEYPDKNGPFRSSRFNFNFNKPFDIELQNDYDGSVNIIFTDGQNPIRIINSGFAVRPGNKYELIDREGTADTNRYSRDNFENIINLITRSTKIMRVEFQDSIEGGVLPAGNYQYLFALSTSDGTETEIVAQSGIVPVFNGDKVTDIEGPRMTGDATNKMNRFILSNLDQSYAYVVVYVVHADGMNSQVRTAYRINQQYRITGSEFEFVHTGYEEKITIPITQLSDQSISIDTAETIAQSQDHLIIANVKEKKHEVEALRKFARRVVIGFAEKTMDIIGAESSLSRLTSESMNQSSLKSGTDAYNGGYANPKNVYYKTGYWGGEAYPFSMRFIYPDGSVSPLFPAIGVDNVDNLNQIIADQAGDETIASLDATGGFASGTMLNNRGIYRFPNRNASGMSPLFSVDTETGEGRVKVLGVTFRIPSLDTDLGGGKTIKDLTIGIQFFRGERKRDAICQGTLIDTIMVPAVRFDQGGDEADEKLWNYRFGQGGFTESNSKLIPAYGHILESSHVWEYVGNPDNRSYTNKLGFGIMPFKFNVKTVGSTTASRDPHEILSDYKSPFAMISTDLMVNPMGFTSLSSRATYTRIIGRMKHTGRITTRRARVLSGSGIVFGNLSAGVADHFSLLAPSGFSIMNGSNSYQSLASWMPGHTEAKNPDGFGSQAFFQCRRNGPSAPFYLFRNSYNDYLGVRLRAKIRASNPEPSGQSNEECGNEWLNKLGQEFDYAYLANIYEGSQQRSALATQQVYQNIDNIRYFPISQKMYWDDTVPDADPDNTLEGQLDSDRKITLFGGDCFINLAYRKLYSNAELFNSDQRNIEEYENNSLVVRTGYTIAIVNEANYNANIRSHETVNLSEGERKHPLSYITGSADVGDAYGRGNEWRDYLLPESAGHNKGYAMTDGNVGAVTLPLDAPYIASHWFARAWASAKHVPNSFENGYRNFSGRHYKDYPTKNGQIVKLIENNNLLYCVQEKSVGIIPLNERIQTGGDTAGPVYIETPSVLGPRMRMVSEEVGSIHKSSIFCTDNAVYGFSIDRQIIWQVIGDRMNRISDLSILPHLNDTYGSLVSEPVKMFDHDVVGFWDKKYNEALFTFYRRESGAYSNERCFTVAFNEDTQKFHSFYTFIPLRYMRVGSDLYSFSIASPQGIWLHDSKSVSMNSFYGTIHPSTISFVVNSNVKEDKVFTNQEILGNFIMPHSGKWMVGGALAERTFARVPNDVLNSNIQWSGRSWKYAIPKVTAVHNQDHEKRNPDVKAGHSSPLDVKSRLKDRYMITELKYITDDIVELESVITKFKPMR